MKFTGKDGELRIYDAIGNYMKLHFTNMDFSGPIGRSKLEETLVMDRGMVDSYAHYITGTDQILFDPLPLSWSCFIDSVSHVETANGWQEPVIGALTCRDGRNPSTDGTWDTYGVSTKGDTQNISGVYNPKFRMPGALLYSESVISVGGSDRMVITGLYDPNILASGIIQMTSGTRSGDVMLIDVNDEFSEVILDELDDTTGIAPGDTLNIYDNHRTVKVEYKLTGETNDIVWVLNEVYFPPEEITFAEAEDAINMSITGGIYGTITRQSDWS